MNQPGVGIGILILNPAGEVLIGKRKGKHAPYFSIPGGKLELGERFEEAAIREIKEETGLVISSPTVFCVANNLKTFQAEHIHFVSVNLIATSFEGEPKVMEKEKCASWQWCNPRQLPQPHFEASELAIACFLNQKFYLRN